MARNGYKKIVYLDDNPLSPTYMQTYEEEVYDDVTCPIPQDDIVLISNTCEIVQSGYTGYRILIYYNKTTGEYTSEREEDPECKKSSSDEVWINEGEPYCETTARGINTGYMIQVQVQSNANLPNYGEKRNLRYKSPACAGNGCAVWDDIQSACHIEVFNCVATFDGTKDVTQIDINPLSETYNQTRTINKEDSGCENCTQTTFSWVEVGDMCGDDSLLCENGIQQTSTNSYTVSQKYKTIGSAAPVPLGEYSVVLKKEDDEDCGYIRPQYKWEIAPGQYLCDYQTYTKYEMKVKWVSYDEGETWSMVYPMETERGEVIAEESYDCGKPMYRWVDTDDFVCVDNGDDAKIMYWNNESVMVSAYSCDESGVVTKDTVRNMVSVSDGIVSPDGYADVYQVGDCVNEIADEAFIDGLDSDLWLGNYTERIGNKALCGYNHITLDIPRMVNDMSNKAFGYSSWNSRGSCMNYECSTDIKYMIFHSPTPPLMLHRDDFPVLLYLDDDSDDELSSIYSDSAVFVPNEYYETYATTDVYSGHVNSLRATLLAMNNDTDRYKAIFYYKTPFDTFRHYMAEGEDSTTIDREEVHGLDILYGLTIGSNVVNIGMNAFTGGHLKTLHISSSVRTIGYGAFNGNPLSSITFDEGVETISSQAFLGNNLETIVIPDSVKTIGEYAFNQGYNGFKTITIGSGCTSIGERAFYQSGLNNKNILENVYVKALTPPTLSDIVIDIFGPQDTRNDYPYGNFTVHVPCEVYEDYIYESQWSYFNKGNCHVVPYGCSGVEDTIAILYQTDGTVVEIKKPTEYIKKTLREIDMSPYSSTTSSITITNKATSIGDNALRGYSSLSSITMSNGITSIGQSAFGGCTGLTSVNIPDGVTTIGDYAFQGCRSLSSVTIPDSVTSIGQSAFYYCTSLTEVTIPNSVTSINDDTFAYCSGLTTAIIGSGVTSIGMHAFLMCSGLTSVTIGNSVTTIDRYVFQDCHSLTSINIPDSVTSIGNHAFYRCSGMTTAVIGNGLTSIERYTFAHCTNLTTVIIGNGVTSIELGVFQDCHSLTSVDIPDNVIRIGKEAFYNCSGLTTAIIGSGVTSIGSNAFSYGTSLISITIKAVSPPAIANNTFGFTNGCILYVPQGSLERYKNANMWKDYYRSRLRGY